VSGVYGDMCHPIGREKARHGETRLGGAYEIAIGAAVRRHYIEHRGGPAVVMSYWLISVCLRCPFLV